MAYVNVKDWSVEQVTEWLKGLDSSINQYIPLFMENEVSGERLLNLLSDDLERLGVPLVGHQELILDSVEYLRNFHYMLDKENLQNISLRLSCTALSLYKELSLTDENCTSVSTQTMSDVHNVITAVKQLVCWLDRSPFRGDKEYTDCKTELLQLSIEMATSAQRDIFSEKPLRIIRDICDTLTQLADHIIRDVSDPMILQPASLALATLKKKKEQELGFFLVPSYYAVHQIAEIKFGSPAHNNSKIEEGDEIVQVNYQTVVGWQRKNVLLLLQESPSEIVLTLKKRPRHTKVYGQIYMKPYRLPSKKRAVNPFSRWNDNLPSPQLLTVYDLPQLTKLARKVPVTKKESVSGDGSSDGDSSDESPLEENGNIRIYPLKPRPTVLQRRNTITGASPTHKKPQHSIEQYWQQLKNRAAYKHSSSYNIESAKYKDDSIFLRDKSFFCNEGLQMAPRPTTVIGFSPGKKNGATKEGCFKEQKNQNKVIVGFPLPRLNESFDFIDEGRDITDRSEMKTYWQAEIVEELVNKINFDAISVASESTTLVSLENRYEFAGVDKDKPKIFPKSVLGKPPELPVKPKISQKPIVPPKNFKQVPSRGIFNKSNSAPTYDQTNETTSILQKLHLDQHHAMTPKEKENSSTGQKNVSTKPKLDVCSTHDTKEVSFQSVIPSSKSPNNSKAPDLKSRETPSQLDCSSLSISSEKQASDIIENFDVRITSTPISKAHKIEVASELPRTRNAFSKVPAVDNKVSPTNSIVKAMISSGRNRNIKKKSNLLSKRRNVSVKDVSPGDLQGYLHQRSRCKQTQPVMWSKLWFVLNGNCLYGFESKIDSRAKCLIFLSGFTVSVAEEVKSRSNAFKVYHTGTVFYFSSESVETRTNWIEALSTAALLYKDTKLIGSVLYSDSDDELLTSGKEKVDSEENKCFGETIKKSNSSKKVSGSRKDDSRNDGSSSLDRKWFFNKSNKNLPVPTPQFRSYRRMPSSISTGNFTSHVPQLTAGFHAGISEPSSFVQPILNRYVHASNPNLCEINTDSPVKSFPSKNVQQVQNSEELASRQHADPEIYSTPDTFEGNINFGELVVQKNVEDGFEGAVSFAKKSCIKKCKKNREILSNSFTPNPDVSVTASKSLPRTHKLSNTHKTQYKQKNNLSKKEYSVSYIDLKDHSSSGFSTPNEKMSDIVRQHSLTNADKREHGFLLSSFKRGDRVSDRHTALSLPPYVDSTKSSVAPFSLENKPKRSAKLKNFFGKHGSGPKKDKPTVSCDFIRDADQQFHFQQNEAMSSRDVRRQNHPITLSSMADYPDLEYPPIFEPETYSLSDPCSNISILKKQDKNH